MSKMRDGRPPVVMMVIEGMYPAVGGGGAESQLRTLTVNLRSRGIDVSVCAPTFEAYPLTRLPEVDGVKVHRLVYPFVPLWGAVVLQSKLALHIWRRRHELDAIHSHIATNMSAVCCVMGRLLGIPVLVKLTGMTEMVGGILDPEAGFGARMRRWAMKRATRIQAISQRIVLQLMAVGFSPKQVMYLPNAVDLRRFDQATAAAPPLPEALAEKLRGVEQSAFVALFAGRLVAAKDLDLLVRGWAACFAGRDDVTLLLAGRGKQGPELMALAQSLGVGQQVRVLGPVEHMEHILPLAHVGILTSRAEGLSNSLLEYMASGLPVLGSCVSGNEDFISPGQTGWLFEPGDEEGLTAGLREAASLSPQALRDIGRNARQRVATQAALPIVLERLCAFYTAAETGTPSDLQQQPGVAGDTRR